MTENLRKPTDLELRQQARRGDIEALARVANNPSEGLTFAGALKRARRYGPEVAVAFRNRHAELRRVRENEDAAEGPSTPEEAGDGSKTIVDFSALSPIDQELALFRMGVFPRDKGAWLTFFQRFRFTE